MGYGVAAIIVILAGVLAWLSFKSWRWANVILFFLLICASATLVYLSAYTLKVQNAWRTQVNKANELIAQEQTALEQKIQGIRDENGRFQGGVRQLSQQVQDLIVRRGPAWFDAKPSRIGGDGGAEITVESPEPHGVPAQSVVYIFEADPITAGGAYLGEFKVTDSPPDSKIVKLVPNTVFTANQINRLRATKGLWSIYLKMPADENEAFVALTDEQAATLLPKDLPESFRKGTRTEQEMTDWVFLFHYYDLQRELLNDDKAKIQSNITRLEESLARNQQKIVYRTQEKKNLETDKQGFEAEKTAVTNYVQELETKSQKLTEELAATRAQIAKYSAELKALQLEAADRINQRTETAQASP